MFKAGLFLGSGSVIHAMHHMLHHKGDHHTDPQDIRNMGGLKAKMPITFWTFVVFTLAISGVPFTSGFLSKDEILAGTLAFGNLTGHYFIPTVGFFVAGLTAFYMFRLLILTFLGEHKDGERLEGIHESPAVMTIPLIVFAVLSFFAFYSFDPFSGVSGWVVKALERPDTVVPGIVAATDYKTFEDAVHYVTLPAMLLSLTVAGLGILIAFATYYWKRINADAVASKLSFVHKFLVNKWFFDELYDIIAVGLTLLITRISRWFDEKIIDGLVNETAKWTVALTFGPKSTWEKRTLGTYAYIAASIILSLYIGFEGSKALYPVQSSIGSYIGHALIGLAIAGIAYFLLYAGVGGFDNKIIDGMVNGAAYLAGFIGIITRKVQTGKIQTYIAFVLLGVLVFFLWFR
jgi:NADH-quinone oxidoreductase subunit L